ncbi:ferredoxin III, nif-specific [Shewanella avicenniae]|uniref:Ferredoxin III n=1 Tax=Shewanella avicenniae TaxID=2814294 RepID=A0ABX7QTK3_9GAMM|nr:ferredoxin III, nif-specific [Shewanella avicenniae]QSX34168.1 ferredoxin III, nif-specific [Shewanella avicenniae]
MSNVVGYTRGGAEWEPQYIEAINQDSCIGCGRCFKVCSRNVFDLVEKEDADEDDLYDEEVMMVMAIADGDDCIGCQACSKVCPKGCHSFAAKAA